MPKARSGPHVDARRPLRYLTRFFGGKRRNARWHWFDHPEMRARIAEAEADLREGRYQAATTAEELQRQLDALKK